MRILSWFYILNIKDCDELLRRYDDYTKEFGVCNIIIGAKEFRDIIVAKDYIEYCISKKQYNWSNIVALE